MCLNFRSDPPSTSCSRNSTELVFSNTVWMTGWLSWTWREWQRKWVSEQMKQIASHGCLKMWWCTGNLWLEHDKTLMHRMLTILKLCQVTVAVLFLITPAHGHTGVLESEGCSMFVYIIIWLFVFLCRHWNKTWHLVKRRTQTWNHGIRK